MFGDIDCGLDHEFGEGDPVYKRAPEVRAIPATGEEFQIDEGGREEGNKRTSFAWPSRRQPIKQQ